MRLEVLTLKAGLDILHVPDRSGADVLNDVLAKQCADDERAERADARLGRHADLVLLVGACRVARGDPPYHHAKMAEVGCSDETKQRLACAGCEPSSQTMDDLVKDLLDGTMVNAELIKLANIRLE